MIEVTRTGHEAITTGGVFNTTSCVSVHGTYLYFAVDPWMMIGTRDSVATSSTFTFVLPCKVNIW